MADEYNNQNIPQNEPKPQQNAPQDQQAPNADTQQQNYQQQSYQTPPQQDYQQQNYQAPPQQNYQQQNYQAPPQQGYQQPYNQQAPNQPFYPPYQPPQEQKASVGFAILSFLIPLAGLIIFLTQKDKRPKTAKTSGICALVSFILNIIIIIASDAFAGAALFSAADDYSYEGDSYYSDFYDYDDSYDYSYDDTYYEFYE